MRMQSLLATIVTVMAFVASPAVAAGPATQGYLVDGVGSALVAFDPATNTIMARKSFGIQSLTYTIRPDGREIYINDQVSDTVLVVSPTTLAVVARIPVLPDPAGVAFTPDSRRAYVSNNQSRSVTVIDTGTREIVKVIPLTNEPRSSAMSPDGSRVYVGTSVPSSQVEVVSTATNTVTNRISLITASPRKVVFAPNGKLAMAGSAIIDTGTEQVVGRVVGLATPSDFVFASDSARIYIAENCAGNNTSGILRIADAKTGMRIKTVMQSGNPTGVALAPDGRRLYVTLYSAGGVAVIDTATDVVLDIFGVIGPQRTAIQRIQVSGTGPSPGRGQRFEPTPAIPPCSG